MAPSDDPQSDLVTLITTLLAQRDEQRAAGNFAAADELRTRVRSLRPKLVELGLRLDEHTWSLRQLDEASGPPLGYDCAWHERMAALRFVSLEVYLSRSASWPHAPRLQTYRELLGKRSDERFRLGVRIGERLGEVVRRAGAGSVVCVEKPHLEGFVAGFVRFCGGGGGGDATDDSPSASPSASPFVLLAVNGGDGPLTTELQARILTLPGLRACYAHNLHAASAASRIFHPLPLGVTPIARTHAGSVPVSAAAAAEALLAAVRARAAPWAQRDRRLLLPPMKLSSRHRAKYLSTLRRAEFRELVRIVEGRLPVEAFLALLAEHRHVLSPPGRGFDCFRTWQALAVGTTPLIVEEDAFDRRLLQLGPRAIPPAAELTPTALAALLEAHDARGPPDEAAVQVAHWERRWRADMAVEAGG